jgi:hypothetical protein
MFKDALGDHGEYLFAGLITSFDDLPMSRFRVCYLGAKWPAADVLLELETAHLGDSVDTRPICFVQVKTTQQDLISLESRLPVRLSREQVRALARYPAPTYLAGIHEPTKQGWLLAVTGQAERALSSMPTDFPINADTRQTLFDEVVRFWEENTPSPMTAPSFVTNDWK